MVHIFRCRGRVYHAQVQAPALGQRRALRMHRTLLNALDAGVDDQAAMGPPQRMLLALAASCLGAGRRRMLDRGPPVRHVLPAPS